MPCDRELPERFSGLHTLPGYLRCTLKCCRVPRSDSSPGLTTPSLSLYPITCLASWFQRQRRTLLTFSADSFGPSENPAVIFCCSELSRSRKQSETALTLGVQAVTHSRLTTTGFLGIYASESQVMLPHGSDLPPQNAKETCSDQSHAAMR